MIDCKPDEAIINTEWGQLAVPRSLLGIWGRSGWPADHVLQRMVEAGSVEAEEPPPRPRRPTPDVTYMVVMHNVRADNLGKVVHLLDRMTLAELLSFGEHVDQLRALITERTT